MSIKLRLESSNDVLDLDSIYTTGVGYQALVGASGLGLPPVTNQWAEGAGDGATYRGRRVRSREIDLPLDILGRDREHLKSLLSRLSIALSGPCRLVVVEADGLEWSTNVVRSGGGGFQYGIDTTGERDLQLVITLTAGDPYFTSSLISQKVVAATGGSAFLTNMVQVSLINGQVIGTIDIENPGDATAYPVWTVHGPGANFQAVSPKGEVLNWTGTLSAGQTLTLDTRNGTVRDGTGVNRYAELAAAPRFWSVPPGLTSSAVSLTGTDANSKVVCHWQARKWMVV